MEHIRNSAHAPQDSLETQRSSAFEFRFLAQRITTVIQDTLAMILCVCHSVVLTRIVRLMRSAFEEVVCLRVVLIMIASLGIYVFIISASLDVIQMMIVARRSLVGITNVRILARKALVVRMLFAPFQIIVLHALASQAWYPIPLPLSDVSAPHRCHVPKTGTARKDWLASNLNVDHCAPVIAAVSAMNVAKVAHANHSVDEMTTVAAMRYVAA